MEFIKMHLREQNAINDWTQNPMKPTVTFNPPPPELVATVAQPSGVMAERMTSRANAVNENQQDFYKNNKELKSALLSQLREIQQTNVQSHILLRNDIGQVAHALGFVIRNTNDMVNLLTHAPAVISQMLPHIDPTLVNDVLTLLHEIRDGLSQQSTATASGDASASATAVLTQAERLSDLRTMLGAGIKNYSTKDIIATLDGMERVTLDKIDTEDLKTIARHVNPGKGKRKGKGNLEGQTTKSGLIDLIGRVLNIDSLSLHLPPATVSADASAQQTPPRTPFSGKVGDLQTPLKE